MYNEQIKYNNNKNVGNGCAFLLLLVQNSNSNEYRRGA